MLNKQSVPINFSQGLDTKTDPYQVSLGRFLSLQNSIFDKGGLLQKRNGFGALTSLPDATSTFVTTFNNNLTAVGTSLQAYSSGSSTWNNKGQVTQLQLTTLPLIRSNLNQTQSDIAIAPNGLVCTVYTDNPTGGAVYKYAIADSVTGQNITAPALIPVSSGAVTGSPRVFLLGNYFIILFTNVISATNHLQYVAINVNNPSVVGTNTDVSTTYTPSTRVNFDAIVANNSMYIAWNGSDGGGAIRMTRLDATLTQHTTVTFTGRVATIMSVTADMSSNTPVLWATFFDSASNTGYTLAVSPSLTTILAPTQWTSTSGKVNVATTASSGVLTIFHEVAGAYSYDSTIATNHISSITVTQGGTVGSASVLIRAVGLASKATIVNGVPYFLTIYSSINQPTYFLYNSSAQIIAKLAYSNGGSYYTTGLPSLQLTAPNVVATPYAYKDLVQAVNKTQGLANSAGVYAQTGINLGKFLIGSQAPLVSSEIGNNLHLSGGYLLAYDGYSPVEQGFFLFPDYVEVTPSATGGGLLAQQYFYIAAYEWSDNQGNIFRSAGSIPVSTTTVAGSGVTFTSIFSSGVSSITVSSAANLYIGQIITDTTTGANITVGTYITSISGTTVGLSLPTAGASAGGGDTLKTTQTASNTVNVPTLRQTYKTANPVKITLYRWSAAQEVYYQVTSISAPTLNSLTTDSVAIVDSLSDLGILGNNIFYTAGGVIENQAAPAVSVMCLFQSRLWLVDAEDPNLLWFSKQVIEGTPVELSDLLTFYVAPTSAAQVNTGPITALSAMDDKLIIFKKDAIYYVNGLGPDNTGANNQYSDPVFITSTVGCIAQESIVFTPQGLMFQSDKGIWLLGRDLNTSYVGAAVEAYNTSQVASAINIPGTNQVRFTLSTGITLMYDYYFGQWGTFVNVPAISSTLYNGLHTYINSRGNVYQETPGVYLDGSSPVLMSFTTSWINLGALQAYERAYFFYFLGTYITPHKINVGIAYDYNPAINQVSTITPDNYNPTYGNQAGPYGSGSPYGGHGTLEQWKVFMKKQRCQAFQITVSEQYDPSFGVAAGAGFTMSGLNMIIGAKKGWRPIKAANTVG